MGSITIPRRWRGPNHSGNGGVTAGLLAGYVDASVVTVTLRRPPPLDQPLDVEAHDDGVVLHDGEVLVATAEPGTLAGPTPSPVPDEVAARAAASYAGLVAHPFPNCFVCGTGRPDGLRLAPGPLGDGRVATPWRPPDASTVLLWAALDCPGGWTVLAPGRPMVLGRITARLLTSPTPGESGVVVGSPTGRSGRKAFSATAAYGGDGRLIGEARAVWIQVDPVAIAG